MVCKHLTPALPLRQLQIVHSSFNILLLFSVFVKYRICIILNISVIVNSLFVKLIFFIKFSISDKFLLLYYLNYARIYEEYKIERSVMDVTIREIQKQEYPLLDNFLYDAIFVPEGIEPPPKTIITSPELQVYVKHFGESKDDWGLVSEVDGKIVGAVWVRIMNDYGHIDDETPSLAISLYKKYRSFGIGTAMMKEILVLLKSHGYRQVSLSVQKANYAAKLYLKVGFEIVKDNEEEYIMVNYL